MKIHPFKRIDWSDLFKKYIKVDKKLCVECGQTMPDRKYKYCSDICQRKKYTNTGTNSM
jgi:hypothetical protein